MILSATAITRLRLSDAIIWTPHSEKQQATVLSDTKITALVCGIQFGKTTAGSIWMKRLMHKYHDKDDNFIITSPNYKIMQQSTLPAFLKFMDGFGHYQKQDAVFKMAHGGTCYLRTATEPDSIVGITNVRGIWGDEAGKYSLYFWENMQARSSFKDCPILLTTSPYTTNWVYKELIKPHKERKRQDLLLITAASNENPHFPLEEFNRRKQTMDPRRFAALYLGEFSRMHGLVYDCFNDEACVVSPYQLPQGTKFYAGVDWGFTDPFVITIRGITPNGFHIQVGEVYRTGLPITDMIMVAKQKKQIFGIQMFYADPSQPGYIEEFNRNGLPCIGAENDIRRGIDAHYELIRSGKYKIFKGSSPHTIDEYESYHYPEPKDLDTDQDSKEQLPVGQDDHAMDAARYLTIMTTRVLERKQPVVPNDISDIKKDLDPGQRIRILKRGRRTLPGTEKWS